MHALRPLARSVVALLMCASPLTAQASFPVAGVDSLFAAYNRTDRPGCAVGVFRNGRVVHARGYGMADLNQGIAISPKTAFYVASTSKQFAAASLTLLAMQGKVSLEDPVRKYVPELPAWGDGIRLRHLMHHTSGIRDYLGLWAISGRSSADEIPEEAALDLIARQKGVDFEPGSRWSYSNSGYFLISVVVKRASGQSLSEYARSNIFEPLGMRDTHFHDDKSRIIPRRAEGYEPDGKGGYRIFKTSYALVGDGGLYTTIEDLAKWDENFYGDKLADKLASQQAVGGPGFIDRLHSRAVLNSGDTTDYAAGLFHHEYRGMRTVDHGGAFIGFRAELLRFPSEHTSIAVACNDYSAAAEAMAKKVADVVLGGRLGGVASGAAASAGGVAVAAATLDRYAGRYELLPGVAGSVARRGDTLELRVFGQATRLTPVDDSTFTSAALPGSFTFRTLAGGRIGLRAAGLGMDVAVPPLGPVPVLSAAERQGVVGRYFSEELQASFVVKDEGGRLMVRGGYGAWMPLEPFQPGAFSAGAGKVTVERDRSGRVTGLVLDAARMKNIKLVRVA